MTRYAADTSVPADRSRAEIEIESFEDAFLPHVVLPSGETIGDWIRPQVAEAYATQRMPALLGMGATS